jgi:hypothetical protein
MHAISACQAAMTCVCMPERYVAKLCGCECAFACPHAISLSRVSGSAHRCAASINIRVTQAGPTTARTPCQTMSNSQIAYNHIITAQHGDSNKGYMYLVCERAGRGALGPPSITPPRCQWLERLRAVAATVIMVEAGGHPAAWTHIMPLQCNKERALRTGLLNCWSWQGIGCFRTLLCGCSTVVYMCTTRVLLYGMLWIDC